MVKTTSLLLTDLMDYGKWQMKKLCGHVAKLNNLEKRGSGAGQTGGCRGDSEEEQTVPEMRVSLRRSTRLEQRVRSQNAQRGGEKLVLVSVYTIIHL